MPTELKTRLRAAHLDSPQRINGSDIFLQAADRIQKLEEALNKIADLPSYRQDECRGVALDALRT